MIYLFWFGTSFTVIAPIATYALGGPTSLYWLTAVCGAFVTFVARLDQLAELSLGPVRAKMRETINEAAATTEQLQNLACVMSRSFLTQLMASQFLGGMTTAKRFLIRDEVIETLSSIGVQQSELDKVESDWNEGVALLFHNGIKNRVHEFEKDRLSNNPRVFTRGL